MAPLFRDESDDEQQPPPAKKPRFFQGDSDDDEIMIIDDDEDERKAPVAGPSKVKREEMKVLTDDDEEEGVVEFVKKKGSLAWDKHYFGGEPCWIRHDATLQLTRRATQTSSSKHMLSTAPLRSQNSSRKKPSPFIASRLPRHRLGRSRRSARTPSCGASHFDERAGRDNGD
jgi:hypothetical protein